MFHIVVVIIFCIRKATFIMRYSMILEVSTYLVLKNHIIILFILVVVKYIFWKKRKVFNETFNSNRSKYVFH